MKTCSTCLIEMPLLAFNRDKRRGHASRCKPCNALAVKAWRHANRDAYNAAGRKRYAESPAKWARHLRDKYGISAADYAGMLAEQGGCCAICKVSAEAIDETLAVDHDHATGKIRGLLCAKCNRMLGCANDKPEVLRAGAEYLAINAKAARIFIEAVMGAA